MNRGTLTVVAQATLVSLLVAGVAVFIGLQKTVVLSVDGKQRTVHTYARTVGDVLEHEKIAVAEHDTVVPSSESPVSSGSFVTMRRGRELVLSIDGATHPVWTTAQDVDEALGQLGLHATDAYVSVSRSGRIPLRGVDVTIRTPHRVSVLVDGKRVSLTSTAPTVAALLREANVDVGARDIVNPAPVMYPLDGDTITVSRVSGKRIVKQVAIPFKIERRADPNMYKGEKTTRREGQPGLVVKTYEATYVDGKLSARKLLTSKKKAEPVTKIVAYGTRAKPQGSVLSELPSGGGLNWAALAKCESGGRPTAVGGGGLYFGLYQFDLSTWHAWGGTGNPIDATPAEQTMRAKMLYNNRGRQPWPICGKFL